tara:strand:- start:547 stop:984 length:438 start_codon:yes stop_codon:yes gene_type:complete
MAKSSKVGFTLTIKSADIVPTGLNRSVSTTVTATDDTSEFGKMVITDSYQRIDKQTIADRAMVYIKNISSTSTVAVYVAMSELSNATTNGHVAGTHNGPRYAEIAVGEFMLLPFKDLDGTDSTTKGVHVKGSAAGEIEYLIFELD